LPNNNFTFLVSKQRYERGTIILPPPRNNQLEK